jgi:hypothetical protein
LHKKYGTNHRLFNLTPQVQSYDFPPMQWIFRPLTQRKKSSLA